jgi:hypothetical protein
MWTAKRCDEGGILWASAFLCGRNIVTAVVGKSKELTEMPTAFSIILITIY